MQLIEPISIVRRDRARPEVEKARENATDRGDIGIDLFAREQRAAGILARGIADLAGAAADERYWPMAGFLQPPQHHDGEKVADMKAGRGCIKTDIGRDRVGACLGVQAFGFRDLMNKSSRRQNLKKIGLVGAHRLLISLVPLL